MYTVIFLSCLLATVYADHTKRCYNDVDLWCKSKAELVLEEVSTHKSGCSVVYGHIGSLKDQLKQYVAVHINASMNYLLMSTHFGGYAKNREGLEKIFRRLSDSTWEDAIDLIKYASKRGLNVEVAAYLPPTSSQLQHFQPQKNFDLDELKALGYALDYQKGIAQIALDIHSKASTGSHKDPEVSSFLENNFLHRHADNVRNMAGLVTDLKNMSKSWNPLSYFIFDEYLQKM